MSISRHRIGIVAAAMALSVGTRPLAGQREPAAVTTHVEAARIAAGTQFDFLFTRLCAAPPAPQPASPPAAAMPAATPPRPAGPPDRASWYAPPVKVFDNLYYVGMSEYSAWAVTTSAGIVLIDTIYDYSVEAEVVDGLRALGLDPKTIKYAIVSHGHADHAGGAKYLQDTFGTKIVMSAADWDLLDGMRGPRPTRDVVATEAMPLVLGDTTITIHVTPGHTLGTLSTVIPVQDHGRTHVAVTWGGTAFNWLANRAGYITPDRPDAFWFRHYIASAQRFRGIAVKAGADVILSNHTNFDGSKTKLPAMGTRTADQPHPYVVGPAAVQGFLTVADECAQAGLARLTP